MKSLFLAALFALSLPVSASAQEYQGCFLIDASRRLIRLPELCPQMQTLPSTTAAQTEPPKQLNDAEIPKIAAFYAGKYCDQRETGVVSREDARRTAWDQTFAMMETLYGLDETGRFIDSSQESLLDAVDRSISLQCPEQA